MGISDFRKQKIRRRDLAQGCAAILAAYAALVLATAAGRHGWLSVYPEWAYYQGAATNAALCVAAAMGLWWMGVWPAGDAKLFMLVGVLYPLTSFSGTTDYRRLFLSALINIFIPACGVVFITAGRYVYRTRFAHRRHFLLQLGRQREFGFLLSSLKAILSGARTFCAGLGARLRAAANNPMPLFAQAGDWIFNILTMAILSYSVRNLIDSPLFFALFWGGVLLFRVQVIAMLGAGPVRVILALLCATLLAVHPPAHWIDCWVIVRSFTVFSLCFAVGAAWAAEAAFGDIGNAYVMTLVMVPAAAALAFAASWLGADLSWHGARTLAMLCVLGAFFGLALVLVRLWDHEVAPRNIEEVTTHAVLAPSFVDRLRADEEFFEENFGRLYADGLTPEQATALQEWCAREGVTSVPVIPTISFASWIFFGFLVTRILEGAQVMAVFH